MRVSEFLRTMDIGNSVAEFDSHLQKFFFETQIYSDFVNGRCDIISGDKGTGKSAIYRIVKERSRDIEQLRDVELISGFNDAGSPIFQILAQIEPLGEGQYITIWKTYFLSLIGNFLLDGCEGLYSENMAKLDRVLLSLDIRTKDSNATTIFSKLANMVRKILQPKTFEFGLTINEAGMPIVFSKLEFGDIAEHEISGQKIINNDDALELLNRALTDLGITIWVVLDRLDEAFVGFPRVETPVLRALLRTYLDLQAYDMLKLKLFVRNDLFRKIIAGGFVNLTHVNARRIQIRWHSEDLFGLLMRRIRENTNLIDFLSVAEISSDEELFYMIFPKQVDVGERKPTTWSWIISRISDGNGLIPPRNLIDLINKAKEMQSRREERAPREFEPCTALIEADAIRKGLDALSWQRVEDTLLAESGEFAIYIDKFKNSKAEHNEETLRRTLSAPDVEFTRIVDEL